MARRTLRTCGTQTVTFTWSAESRLASYTVGGQTVALQYDSGVAGAQGPEWRSAEPFPVGQGQPPGGAHRHGHRARRGILVLRTPPAAAASWWGHRVQRPCRRPRERHRAHRRRADGHADLRLYGVGAVRSEERR